MAANFDESSRLMLRNGNSKYNSKKNGHYSTAFNNAQGNTTSANFNGGGGGVVMEEHEGEEDDDDGRLGR